MTKANYEQKEDCDLLHGLYAPLALKQIVERSCNNKRHWKKNALIVSIGERLKTRPFSYLSMKQSSLSCFVLSCWDFMVLHTILLVSLESSERVRVHQLGLKLFGVTMWKPMIIEPFSQWKLNKLKTENYIGMWKHSWCCWNALSESDLIKLISQFSKLRYRRYWFWSGFCCWKLKQIAKNGKNQWALNVFTLGSPA